MARILTISSKQLFHKGNNPCMRLDAEGAHAIAALTSPEPTTNAREVLEDLLRDRRRFNQWIAELRTKTTLKEVIEHITYALIYKHKPDHLSDEMKAGIEELARLTCEQEQAVIRKEISKQLRQISQLDTIAQTPKTAACQ